MKIDTIKSQARRAAWRSDSQGDEFNPFNRRVSRESTLSPKISRDQPAYDEEAAIGRDTNGISKEMNKQNLEDSPTSTEVGSQNGAAGEYYGNGAPSRSQTLTNDNDLSKTESGPVKRNGILPPVSENEKTSTDQQRAIRNHDDIEEENKRKHAEAMKAKIPIMQQVRTVLFPRWFTINWMLIAVPVGIALHVVKVDPLAIFVVNFIAIVPLAGLLSFATEEIAMRIGEVLGGLLNASFGNAVELIVGILALVKGQIVIVQTSLIGSILSNLLLVLGMCFFFGGVNRTEQHFNITVAQTAASILALAVGGVLIPTAFTWGQGAANPATNLDEQLSYATSIILLLVYGAYLYFQLSTHREMYNAPSKKVAKNKGAKKSEGDASTALAQMGGIAIGAGGRTLQDGTYREPDEEPEVPTLSLIGALVTLCGATALIGICAEFMVDSINEVTCKYHVSQYFVGLILLPIVGNAAEHATAVTVAIKDKMDLAIGVAVGSSMQIALLVLPLMVILGWIIGEDMTLVFDDFQIVVLFVAVILVNYLIGDGKSRKHTQLKYTRPYILLTLIQTGSKALCSWRSTSSLQLHAGFIPRLWARTVHLPVLESERNNRLTIYEHTIVHILDRVIILIIKDILQDGRTILHKQDPA
jgi:Ca2+:H+ antiporter